MEAEGNRSHPGAPPVRGVLWRGVGSGSLTSGGTDLRGHCVQAHIPGVFRDLGRTGEDIGRVRVSALQTILRVLGGSGGLIWLCGRATEYHRVSGGS
jgi:hypothetical protein